MALRLSSSKENSNYGDNYTSGAEFYAGGSWLIRMSYVWCTRAET